MMHSILLILRTLLFFIDLIYIKNYAFILCFQFLLKKKNEINIKKFSNTIIFLLSL